MGIFVVNSLSKYWKKKKKLNAVLQYNRTHGFDCFKSQRSVLQSENVEKCATQTATSHGQNVNKKRLLL